MDSSLRARRKAKREAIQKEHLDCFGAADLAMTRALGHSVNPALDALRCSCGGNGLYDLSIFVKKYGERFLKSSALSSRIEV
jgi:hypothetical protein